MARPRGAFKPWQARPAAPYPGYVRALQVAPPARRQAGPLRHPAIGRGERDAAGPAPRRPRRSGPRRGGGRPGERAPTPPKEKTRRPARVQRQATARRRRRPPAPPSSADPTVPSRPATAIGNARGSATTSRAICDRLDARQRVRRSRDIVLGAVSDRVEPRRGSADRPKTALNHSVRVMLSDLANRKCDSIRSGIALGVEPQQVVLGEAEAADGRVGFQATMWAMPVVAMEPGGQVLCALV